LILALEDGPEPSGSQNQDLTPEANIVVPQANKEGQKRPSHLNSTSAKQNTYVRKADWHTL
jgi:hypothetical protein